MQGIRVESTTRESVMPDTARYIYLSVGFEYDLPGCPTGGYSSVRRDACDDEHVPVEYEPSMERRIYRVDGHEWYRVVDRHGNLI